MRRTWPFVAILLGGCLLGSAFGAQPATGVVRSEDIEAALRKPAPAAATPPSEPMKTRGLRLQVREEESRDTAASASIDLQIAFALESATLLPEARRQLDELVKALKSQALAGQPFVLAGHTDASGRADHNRTLSLARANSVREYLAKAGVDTARLAVTGHGADRPLPGLSPYDAANRRVEIRSGEVEP
jgi:outer membrane protein OmpA-like peptidoglycan-associated protein